MLYGRREHNFINGCIKFDFAAKKLRKFRTGTLSVMGESHAGWHQVKPHQLPAHTNEGRRPKLDLMPIQVSTYADVLERYAGVSAVNVGISLR
jgi:hypothetical protein